MIPVCGSQHHSIHPYHQYHQSLKIEMDFSSIHTSTFHFVPKTTKKQNCEYFLFIFVFYILNIYNTHIITHNNKDKFLCQNILCIIQNASSENRLNFLIVSMVPLCFYLISCKNQTDLPTSHLHHTVQCNTFRYKCFFIFVGKLNGDNNNSTMYICTLHI